MSGFVRIGAVAGLLLATAASLCPGRATAADKNAPAGVRFQWGQKIPMRDGVQLNATVYLPDPQAKPAPCVFTLTPYISQSYHDRGMYFASHGLPFLTVDVRGRGNSEGTFRPLIQEARDGHDVVEWLARQPYCDGKVTMWGGSYAGYDQWATAKEFPPHLATIVPVASPYAGVDFPMSWNSAQPYGVQWLTFVSGRAGQPAIFGDSAFWRTAYKRLYDSGAPLRQFDTIAGNPLPVFQEWRSHPHPDAYWDAYNPSEAEYARLALPILTITGMYDGDQPGALTHYRQHMRLATPEARARHYLVIGPWDHAGTRTPQAEFGGLKFGPASLVDLPKLHLEWYAWTMQGGPKPEFLQKPVAYYVTGAERWRYAETLAAVTGESRPMYLGSTGAAANDVFASGTLADRPAAAAPDSYLYDPRDLTMGAVEAAADPDLIADQRYVLAARGRQLVYHTAPFLADTELSGFFRLTAWLAIDQPDTDFTVSVSEVDPSGALVPLASTFMRARYREDPRRPVLVNTREPLRYDFTNFTFASRLVRAGSRLRLVIGPADSIYMEKNYNAGGAVAEESVRDARTVKVSLYHDAKHPSALYLPVAAPERAGPDRTVPLPPPAAAAR